MRSYSVAEAKAKFSEMMQLAASGEEVRVTKHGKPYVRLINETGGAPIESHKMQKIDWDRLKQLRQSMPPLGISAVELVRQIRENND